MIRGAAIMSVLVFGSSKGGVGKSSLAIATAASFARHGCSVACVDADPNAALMNWYQVANVPGLSVSVEIEADAIVSHIMERAINHDITIVDTGGWMNQTSVFSFAAATCVLIPVMPDRNSVIEARRTARKVESVAEIARRKILCRLLLNRWTPRGLLEKATLNDLDSAGLPYLRQYIPNLTAFAKASFAGEVPHNEQIGIVMDNIIAELIELGAIVPKEGRAVA